MAIASIITSLQTDSKFDEADLSDESLDSLLYLVWRARSKELRMWSTSVAWKSRILDLMIMERDLESESVKAGHWAYLYRTAEK